MVNGGNCQLPGINWVHFVHAAFDFEAGGGLRGFKRRLERNQVLARERHALQQAELVITNSESTRREVLKHFGLDESRVRRIYLGIDAERFSPMRAPEAEQVRRELGVRGPFALFVGALGDRRKGFDVAFDAWRTLCREREWDVDLVVAGAGAELECWRRRAVELGLGDRVRFLGFRNDVARVVAAASLLIAPSRYEPYGLGIAEALASHVPAIASRRAGITELYPALAERFVLDDPESAGELSARVRAFFAAPAEAAASFQPLFAEVRARSWQVMAAEMLDAMALH